MNIALVIFEFLVITSLATAGQYEDLLEICQKEIGFTGNIQGIKSKQPAYEEVLDCIFKKEGYLDGRRNVKIDHLVKKFENHLTKEQREVIKNDCSHIIGKNIVERANNLTECIKKLFGLRSK